MSQHRLPINSLVSGRGGSMYLLLPPPIRDEYNLTKGVKCKIFADDTDKIHVVFDQ